jgi:RecB family exonuclease
VLSEDPVPLFALDLGDRSLEVSLTGAIDRVDVMEEGDELLAFILDYKTGEVTGNRARTERGQLFQLPLYSRVIAQLLSREAGGRRVRPIAAAYYQLGGPAEVGIEEPLVERAHLERIGTPKIRRYLPEGGFEQLIDACVDRSREVVRAHLDGKFHPTAVDDFDSHCKRCDFAHVCRGNGEATRLARMESASLFPQERDLIPRERKQGS